ncbi:LysR family transcriptional regulator [Thalassomonas actiniarum]|uniref:LysR family transcriptional regulator n=2 Tax=Thalassomonas actiniarum TaxID=485447 RepID=A0AAE9YKM6_9GAMM|nr:LysR family transcriptional regulator [Thalassomonas actiniarum]
MAVVGRRISALEHTLGFKLLNRTTRQMHITPAGQSYYQGCKSILAEVSELEDSLTSQQLEQPGGLIRLSAPDSLADTFLLEAIKHFQSDYPDIRFDLQLENQHVDLIEQDIDLTFRLAVDLIDSSYVAVKLFDTSLGLYAAPDYLAARGVPKNIKELEKHDCLNMGASRFGSHWSILVEGELARFKQPWKLSISSGPGLLLALTQGMGIGMVPELFAQPHVEVGELTLLTGVADFPAIGLYLIYPSRQHLPYRLKLFLEFIKKWCAENH